MQRITMYNVFGKHIHLIGSIVGEITRGFDLASGAWCAYDIDGTGKPAIFVKFLRKHSKKPILINKKNIIRVQEAL